jgi:prepilin-type N-terminal cleavage/methylation domain-containing protein
MKKAVFHPQKIVDSRGFTIIELLIATAVFSVIMVVITAGIISFTRQYYKGVITSNTQTTARTIMSQVTQAIQFGGSITTGLVNGSTEAFCVDNKMYSYIIGQQVNDGGANAAMHQNYHGLVADNTGAGCDAATVPPSLPTVSQLGADQREMLGDKMRLSALDISTPDGQTYTVHLRIIYGEDDLLEPSVASLPIDWSKEKCQLNRATLQYCAITDLTTTIQKRIQ